MNIGDINVLVVEDDDFQRRILTGMLRSAGVGEIFEAANGRHGLDTIQSIGPERIHVALCDLNMPEMDGMEFLRHMAEESRSIAVILTSSLNGKLLSSVGRMARMYGIELLDVIEKPVLLTNLKEALLKYDHSKNGTRPRASMNFSLGDIFKGIYDNQFVPYFQPKVDMKSGRLIGAEALARWLHPVHGVVGPDAFIPLLEQTGNIDDLTFRILKKTAQACRQLHEDDHILTISVNLSLVSLKDTNLADKITAIIREEGIDPQYIVLEITESAAMTEVAPALENLARLCMNGFSLSIDDYGTGSSNLQQLLRIAFSELKIDQSFVRDFTDNKSLQIVVASSIDMARKLQVKSVAEGVETQQDWDGLNAIGCDTAQGYFIGKPMDIKAFREFAVSFKSRPIPAQPAPNPDVAQKRSALKVLIVEDDDFTRKIIMSVFRDLGFTNLSDVNNASSAVKLLENHVYDLIVTDIKMPGMNGLQFIQMIRAGKTLAKPDTRIVVLTSYSQTAILGSALALDVNGFLVKPVVPTIVEEKLSRALSERLNVHSPVAYESVKTDLDNLTPASKPASAKEMGRRTSDIQVQPAPAAAQAPAENKGNGETSLSLYRLRPGMILREGVYLKDGTLILSSGQTLSELSINRLNDLKTLLSSGNVLVQENLA